MENMTYLTVEHAFQAAESLDIKERNRVQGAIAVLLEKRTIFHPKMRNCWDTQKPWGVSIFYL